MNGSSLPAPNLYKYPFDGTPEPIEFSRNGLRLRAYYWPPAPAYVTPARILVLLHGVRSHTRLTWLLKKPLLTEARSPLYSALDFVTPLHDSSSDLTPSTEESTSQTPQNAHWRTRLLRSLLKQEDDKQLLDLDPHSRTTNVFYSGSWIHALCESGAGVFGLDLQGHGLSDGFKGRRCTVQSYDEYVSDLQYFLLNVVRAKFPREKLHLIGVSFSGNIVMRLLQRSSSSALNLDGVIIVAGMFRVTKALQKKPYKLLAEVNRTLISHWFPHAPLVPLKENPLIPEWSSRVGDKDPYLHRGPFTSQMVAQTIYSISAMWRDIERTSHTPRLLLMHNYRDSDHCCWLGTFEVYKALKKTSEIDTTCIIFNFDHSTEKLNILGEEESIILNVTPLDISHTLVNDLDNGYVFGQFMNWFVESADEGPICPSYV